MARRRAAGIHKAVTAMADLRSAEAYAHQLLSKHLHQGFFYHNWEHALDVTRRATIYAREESIPEAEARLLTTAGFFHDTGFTRVYDGHEEASAQIAGEVLPAMGYTDTEVQMVAQLILATRIPQHPASHLEQIFCDADLDHFGRDDFFERGDLLRREIKAIRGRVFTDAQWLDRQARLLEPHAYFTPSARKHRDAGKAQNLRKIQSIRARLQ